MAISEEDHASDHQTLTADANHESELFPEGGRASWMVVLGSFALLTASYGLMFSVGIFQSYFEEHTLRDYGAGKIGWIPGVFVFVALTTGIQVGPLFDRYGPTRILMFGTVCYVASFVVLAQCSAYWQIMLCFGVWAGVGAACLSTTAIAVIPHYFNRRVGIAMGVALSGAGIGGVVFPFILRAGFNNLGWAWTMRLLALILAVLGVLGTVLVRSRMPRKKVKGSLSLRPFKDSRFTWLTMCLFFLELTLYAIIGLLPTFVLEVGFSTGSSTSVIAVLNSCSIVGSFANGYLADRFGRMNSLFCIPLFGILAVFAVWFPSYRTLPGLFVFAAIFGLLSGAFTIVAPACISQISPTHEIGSRIGTCFFFVSFASLISIPLGGEVLERVGEQNLIITLGSLLVAAWASCATARWACLEYQWRWRIKI